MLSVDDCADSAGWKEGEAWTQVLCVHMAAEGCERGTLGTWATVTDMVCSWA